MGDTTGKSRAESNRQKREADRRRDFHVFCESALVTSFNPEMVPEASTVEGVVKVLVAGFAETGDDGFESMDMTVWLVGRLVALVRKGPDGQPQSTIFPD